MEKQEIIEIIKQIAKAVGIDPNLAIAIASIESGFDSDKVRYEPGWVYLFSPEKYASKLGITSATEVVLQKISWGPMQVMGSVARELAYDQMLTDLIVPNLSIALGCRKLEAIGKKYDSIQNIISSYNAGIPAKMLDGTFKNQRYVDDVMSRYEKLNQGGTL